MISFSFPAPAPLLSMNDRMHWGKKAAATKKWRWAAYTAVADAMTINMLTAQPPSLVTISLPVRDSRRRDPHNYFATVKPIIDGLVDAGLWPDDTPEWVTTTEPRLTIDRQRLVVVQLRERQDEAA